MAYFDNVITLSDLVNNNFVECLPYTKLLSKKPTPYNSHFCYLKKEHFKLGNYQNTATKKENNY